jgi:hypothetical protein
MVIAHMESWVRATVTIQPSAFGRPGCIMLSYHAPMSNSHRLCSKKGSSHPSLVKRLHGVPECDREIMDLDAASFDLLLTVPDKLLIFRADGFFCHCLDGAQIGRD